MDNVAKILSKCGPLSSDVLAAKLAPDRSATALSTARKQIERAVKKGAILSTHPVRFNKTYLYYLEGHQRKRYVKAVRELLPKKPTFLRVYRMLLNNKGYITIGQIGKASGCVPQDAKYTTGRRSRLDTVQEQLQGLGLIEDVKGYPGIYKMGKGFGTTQVKLGAFIKFIELEQALLKDFVRWVQNVYIIGKESYHVRVSQTEVVGFNTTCWDFQAPLFFGPATRSTEVYSKSKQIDGFCVVDIVGYRPFAEDDAEAMLERLKTITLNWRRIKVFAVALAMNYSRNALSILRKHGIAPVTFKEVWGRSIHELLKLHRTIVSRQDAQTVDSLEKAHSISKGLVAKDGVFGCIKGDLFEVMTALAYRCNGYQTTLQKKITSPVTGEDFEIDVVASKVEKECLLIECKGRNLSEQENREELKRHFEDRCKVASEVCGWDVTRQYEKVHAIYLTTGRESSIPEEYRKLTESHGILCHTLTRKKLLECFNAADKRLGKLVREYY